MKSLVEYILEAKLDLNSEDNKVIDYVISSFNDHFDEFIKGVKKICDDWDCDINDIVTVKDIPYDKVKIDSIKTLHNNLSKYDIKLPKAKANDLSFNIAVKYYYDADNITSKSSSYALKDKDIDKLRDEFIFEGFEFTLKAKPNKLIMFIAGHDTGLRDNKWINIAAGYHKLDDVKDVIDNYCYKCPLFENPNKIVSVKTIKEKMDKLNELMSKVKLDDKPTNETPIDKLINKESDVVKYIFNDILNISYMDVNWDEKETVEFGEEFIKLVSDWAKDVKSNNELTVYSSKPKYWEDLTDVSIKRMQKSKISNLLTKDSISCDEWVEVNTNSNYLVIVADMHDVGSDYFDLVIEK